jgi:hypothetical protein
MRVAEMEVAPPAAARLVEERARDRAEERAEEHA